MDSNPYYVSRWPGGEPGKGPVSLLPWKLESAALEATLPWHLRARNVGLIGSFAYGRAPSRAAMLLRVN